MNKVAIDDFIILKKALESNSSTSDTTKYKVLDIQSEAPEFIKQKKFLAEELTHNLETTASDANVVDIFGDGINNAPLQGLDTFSVNYQPFASGSSAKIHEFGTDVYIEFVDTITNVVSKRYQASSISTDFGTVSTIDESKYTFRLEKLLGEDVNFITNDSSGVSPTFIRNGVAIRIYKYIPKNAANFDGRFFVKINNDTAVTENILTAAETSASIAAKYRTRASKRIYLMSSDHHNLHRSALTGMTHGAYADKNKTLTTADAHTDDVNYFNANLTDGNQYAQSSNGRTGLGPFASFFRNYNAKPDDYRLKKSNGVYEDVGQYYFGGGGFNSSKNSYYWTNELAHVTVGNYFKDNYAGASLVDLGVENTPDLFFSSSVSDYEKLKKADNRITDVSGTDDNRADYSVWYVQQGPRWAFQNTSVYKDLRPQTMTWGYQSSQDGIFENGTNGASRLNLALGGIFNKQVLRGGSGQSVKLDNFWAIGEDGDGKKILLTKFIPQEVFRENMVGLIGMRVCIQAYLQIVHARPLKVTILVRVVMVLLLITAMVVVLTPKV